MRSCVTDQHFLDVSMLVTLPIIFKIFLFYFAFLNFEGVQSIQIAERENFLQTLCPVIQDESENFPSRTTNPFSVYSAQEKLLLLVYLGIYKYNL